MKATFAAAILVAIGLGGFEQSVWSQVNGNAPVALVISYRARPGARVQLRRLMQTEGVAQLNGWQRQGLFASYQALFTSHSSDATPDMFLVIRLNHFTDLARWQKLEETNPGGLPAGAQSIASVASSDIADIVSDRSVAPETSESQYLVLEYDVFVDTVKYRSYVQEYVVPQFDLWERTSALSSYTVLVNRNPKSALGSSLILLRYRDIEALSSREAIKNHARADLAASNPVWKRWSEDKAAIRREKAVIPSQALRP